LTRAACPLCATDGGLPVVRHARWRLVRAVEAGFPAFYRVVWNEHVAEFSDLAAADRAECMGVVVQVEEVLRRELRPAKVNLASLGNAVPHLHWHVVARFAWDPSFPGSVWSPVQREAAQAPLRELDARLPEVDAALLRILR
jgi:diadenosine tetraphosphate (Ap4A) HIT family hydrolase